MKQVTINLNREPITRLTGWLFVHAGLRLVVAQEDKRYNWHVYEYSTGRQANYKSDKTRKATIEIMKNELDNRSSLQICQVLQIAINESGILNN